jgi:hypothetical protein
MALIKHGHGDIIGPDQEQDELEKVAGRQSGWTPADTQELARENEQADNGLSGGLTS